MWAIIKVIIGIAIALMAFSFLLGSFLLPLIAVTVPQAAHAQTMVAQSTSQSASQSASPNADVKESAVEEEEVTVPQRPVAAQASDSEFNGNYEMPASERLVVPTSDKKFERIVARDLMTDVPLTEQEAVGVLTQEESGFRPDVWQGVSRERAEVLLRRIRENGLKSPAAQDILRQLLLVRAAPPESPSDSNWLALRIRTLQAMGMAQAGHRLLNRLPLSPEAIANLGHDDIARAWVNDKLLHGEVEPACAHVKAAVMNTDAPYWQQAMMVCQAISGSLEELRLSDQVSSDRERTTDPLLFRLFDAVLNSRQSPRLAPEDTFKPLHVSLYHAYPRLINPEVIRRLPDVSLRRIVKTPERSDGGINNSLRLQAAEKLVNDFGRVEDVSRLTDLYGDMSFSSEKVAAPLKFVRQEVDGSRARALLWQGARAADLPSGQALALKTLWERAEKDHLNALPGYLSPELLGIEPQRNLAWFSPYVIKMALRGGNLSTAQAWWDVLAGNRSLSRDLTVERTDIAMAFAMLDGKIPEGVLDQWWSTQTLHNLESRLKTTRVLAIMEALEMAVPSDLWISIHHEFNDAHVDTPPGPGPIWLRLVGRSLEEENTAEAVLMLLEPLMYGTPTNLPPQGMANIVAGLNYLGRLPDARALALEAVIRGEGTSN